MLRHEQEWEDMLLDRGQPEPEGTRRRRARLGSALPLRDVLAGQHYVR
jgi:hypothetical protein